MKVKIITMVACMSYVAASFSQASEPAPASKAAVSYESKVLTPEDAAKEMQMRITRILQLDAETSGKLYLPALEYFKQKQAAVSTLAPATAAKVSAAKPNEDEVAKLINKRNAAFKEILGDTRYSQLQQHIAASKSKQPEIKSFAIEPDAILLE
jgi:hypothetical protein